MHASYSDLFFAALLQLIAEYNETKMSKITI